MRRLTDADRQLRAEARRIYNAARQTGRIVPKKACEKCGGFYRVQGHHRDYTKPLDVQWLCLPCHRRADRLVARGLGKAPAIKHERTHVVYVKVTPSERADISLLCALDGLSESDLLRNNSIAGIVHRAEQVRAAVRSAGLTA